MILTRTKNLIAKMRAVQSGCGFCYELLTYVHEAPCSSKSALTLLLICRKLEQKLFVESRELELLNASAATAATNPKIISHASKTPRVKLLKNLVRHLRPFLKIRLPYAAICRSRQSHSITQLRNSCTYCAQQLEKTCSNWPRRYAVATGFSSSSSSSVAEHMP